MTGAIKSIAAAGLMALCPLSVAAAQSVGADAPSLERANDADAPPQSERFRSTMNRVFSPGRWRQTSGYRPAARENELRRQGAGVAPAGHLSHHSLGSPEAPGAYDVVVTGMSQRAAAAANGTLCSRGRRFRARQGTEARLNRPGGRV